MMLGSWERKKLRRWEGGKVGGDIEVGSRNAEVGIENSEGGSWEAGRQGGWEAGKLGR
jgi:hypothetical protein